MHIDNTPLVRLTGVGHQYQTSSTNLTVLEGIDLVVKLGELVAIVGPSGCGKSTLLELICGLQQPTAGTVEAAPAVYMPQRDMLLPWLSALDNAALPLRLQGHSKADARARAKPLMEAFGLESFTQTLPHQLSGGMRQRVAFARTLLTDKPVLALDEPFAALDSLTRQDMQLWLANMLAHTESTIVFVTHDVEEAILLADHILILTPRPARLKHILEIPLQHPRKRSDQAVVALRAHALDLLHQPVEDEGAR